MAAPDARCPEDGAPLTLDKEWGIWHCPECDQNWLFPDYV